MNEALDLLFGEGWVLWLTVLVFSLAIGSFFERGDSPGAKAAALGLGFKR